VPAVARATLPAKVPAGALVEPLVAVHMQNSWPAAQRAVVRRVKALAEAAQDLAAQPEAVRSSKRAAQRVGEVQSSEPAGARREVVRNCQDVEARWADDRKLALEREVVRSSVSAEGLEPGPVD
jgi:hypothetical protein